LPELLKRHQSAILENWLQYQKNDHGARSPLSDAEMRENARALLDAIREAAQAGSVTDVSTDTWSRVRSLLSESSKTRAKLGFSPAETARFVFSLKQSLFELLQREYASDPKALAAEIWAASLLVDSLGLLTTDASIQARDEMVARQQREMLELSTPVVKLWHGIVAVPLIGTLDSERTQVVMESLLEQVVSMEAAIAIIDITGVPTVDTLVAQHLLKTVAAARLMGAECIISGIRPQIAATIVHLGVDLGGVVTKASLADAFALALRRMGLGIGASLRSAAKEDRNGSNTGS
jgi:rsbT co-antagonist protein RsbR